MSEDAMTANKLMILIHGSGVVRAGQWARRFGNVLLSAIALLGKPSIYIVSNCFTFNLSAQKIGALNIINVPVIT